jgi:hypothetical protein
VKALLPRAAIHWILVMGIAFSPCSAQEASTSTRSPNVAAKRSQGPDLLSFDELVALASTARPEGALGDRLNALLNTPFVHSGTAGDIQPHRPNVNGLGPILAWASGTSKEASISTKSVLRFPIQALFYA